MRYSFVICVSGNAAANLADLVDLFAALSA
jgi:hypothetical protein